MLLIELNSIPQHNPTQPKPIEWDIAEKANEQAFQWHQIWC